MNNSPSDLTTPGVEAATPHAIPAATSTATPADAQSTSNMSPDSRRKTADGLVGVFTLIGLLLGLGAFLWLKNNVSIAPAQVVNVQFHDVASLNDHAAVFANGVRVGTVSKVDITGSESVKVQLKIDSKKVAIPVGSRFVIFANGVVGAKYIEIILPKSTSKNQKIELLKADTLVQGEDPVRPEVVMNNLFEQLDQLDVPGMQSKLSRSMDKIGNVADHVTVLSKKMEPVADQAKKATADVSALANQAKVTASDVGALAKQMQTPVKQMEQILDKKHPLMHMMLGRPGHLKDETKEKLKSDSKSVKVETVQSEAVSVDDGDTVKKKHHLRFWKNKD